MELEEEYRFYISTLRNRPKELESIVKIFEIRKRKLLLTVENSENREKLWDVKTRLSFLEEFKREIIAHSKPE